MIEFFGISQACKILKGRGGIRFYKSKKLNVKNVLMG